MLALRRDLRVFTCLESVDFRKGIDSLAALCKVELGQDPRDGSLFLFCNHRRTAVKILVYDDGGYWLIMRRLSKGKLSYWPRENHIDSKALQVLLSGG